MDIEGIVWKILPPVVGNGAKGTWTKQDVVLELPGEFNRKACVSFWGDKVKDVSLLKEGVSVSISINIESREYNGRWYTELRAWRVSLAQTGQVDQGPAQIDQPPLGSLQPEYNEAENDDLPF